MYDSTFHSLHFTKLDFFLNDAFITVAATVKCIIIIINIK